jgi:hypothetical protein
MCFLMPQNQTVSQRCLHHHQTTTEGCDRIVVGAREEVSTLAAFLLSIEFIQCCMGTCLPYGLLRNIAL